MNELDKNIVHFIKKHHVLNLAVSNRDLIWAASCFYAFWNEKNAFVFLSDEETLHASIMKQNQTVAGTITLETRIVGKIQGLQFKGIVEKAENELLAMAKKIYYKRFPYALGTQSTFWILTMQYAKLTDNRLGFGKKIIWQLNKTEKPILK
ncbi:MAG: hypothetical protein ACUVQP_05675 [Bacteroidales bacterium]